MYLASTVFKDARQDLDLIGAEAALEMATVNGARALGLEGEIGAIEVGMKADLVLFDADNPVWQPLHNPVYNLVLSASGATTDTVIVDGEVVVDGGQVSTIDTDRLVERMRELAPAFRARSGEAIPSRWPIV